jgi:CheY-like chemotaxis protein
VALVLADLWMPDMTGIELLTKVHALDPAAKRALLTGWGDLQVGDRLVRAAVLGQVDDWGLKPWQPGDEGFHQLVVGLLYEWAQLYRPGFQAVQVVGEQWSARAHELRDLLARNKVLYGFRPADSQEGRALLEQVGATTEQLPVVVTFNGQVLCDPSFAEVAEALSVPTRPAAAAYDVTVVGAGPAGLAAAMYRASEGLGTARLEPEATGGQAGTTSMIRNYLGFPRGISGTELAYRACHQAIGFGADIVYGHRELEATANLTLRYNTEAVDGHGDGRLSGLTLNDHTSGATQTVPATALFVLIGAEPHTGWLPDTSAGTGGGSWSPAPTCSPTASPRPAGHWTGPRCRWRRACPACSRPATSATGRPSGSPARSGRARSPSAWSMSTWPVDREWLRWRGYLAGRRSPSSSRATSWPV